MVYTTQYYPPPSPPQPTNQPPTHQPKQKSSLATSTRCFTQRKAPTVKVLVSVLAAQSFITLRGNLRDY